MRFCLIAATFLAAGSSAYMVPIRREYPVSGGSGDSPCSDSTSCEEGQSTSANSPVTGVPSASVSMPTDIPPAVTESDSGYPAPTETESSSPDSGSSETESDSGYPAPTVTESGSPDSGSSETESGSGYPVPTETESSSPDSGSSETESGSGYPAPTETETSSPDSGSVSIPIFSTSATDAAGGGSGTYPTIAPPERF